MYSEQQIDARETTNVPELHFQVRENSPSQFRPAEGGNSRREGCSPGIRRSSALVLQKLPRPTFRRQRSGLSLLSRFLPASRISTDRNPPTVSVSRPSTHWGLVDRCRVYTRSACYPFEFAKRRCCARSDRCLDEREHTRVPHGLRDAHEPQPPCRSCGSLHARWEFE